MKEIDIGHANFVCRCTLMSFICRKTHKVYIEDISDTKIVWILKKEYFKNACMK
jgi:hypothetical protein